MDVCGTLETIKPHLVATPWVVRHLTPRACEWLQGFPDDFTRIPWGARKRIKAHELLYICAEWIGERIAVVEALELC